MLTLVTTHRIGKSPQLPSPFPKGREVFYPSGRTGWNRVMRMGGTLGCLPVPGLRWRFTLACGLPPILGLFVCFDPVTGVPLSLHPGLCSASPSGLLLGSNYALLCNEKEEELVV